MQAIFMNVLNVLKYFYSAALITPLVTIVLFKKMDKKALIKEAPDIFIKQISSKNDFLNLNQGFKNKKYYNLSFGSRRNKITNEENIQIIIDEVAQEDINIKKNMLYISIKNKDMYGPELKILDHRNNKQIMFEHGNIKYLNEKQRIGLFVDYYQRPYKFQISYQNNIFEYNIYDNKDGSVKVRNVKSPKNKK